MKNLKSDIEKFKGIKDTKNLVFSALRIYETHIENNNSIPRLYKKNIETILFNNLNLMNEIRPNLFDDVYHREFNRKT